MKLTDFKAHIDRFVSFNKCAHQTDVVIAIKLPYATVGGSPYIEVESIFSGFKWDADKVFIVPADKLTILDEKIKESVSKLQERADWLDYENRNLKAEIKKLKKEQV